MARGCICCVKYMLFLFNLLFWGSFATLSPAFPSLSAANLVITLGTIVMVTGFLGCLGAIKENKCLLLSVRENARRDLKDGLVLYATENNAGLQNAWNTIQSEWRCCGVESHTDWHAALQEKVVPDRCCQDLHPGCGRNASSTFWTRVRLL
ncbi:hypothetical protein CRUP_023863 [Coryphaenoides rupestris]|nr:hypothetical protein CRUP_023863 [Coryphaenoides rupestris]